MLTRRKLLNQAALSGAALAAARFGLAAKVAVDPHAIEKFRASLAGRLIVPGDAAYDGARGVVYVNPANDKRPAMIAKCARDSDVARCVEFARTHDLPIAVRSGGHSFLGWGTCNGGFVIDVSPLKSVSIDATARTVDAGCGLTAQELVASAARFGLAPVLGECATVGISGLTLGGGVGWLSGRYGAASDNLLSANLTTADGGAATVDQQSNPDLFWAIRGGGGNFGIATSLRLKLHPIGDVLAGGFTYELPRARAVLQYFRDFMATAPDELQTLAYLTPEQGGRAQHHLRPLGRPRRRRQVRGRFSDIRGARARHGAAPAIR
jgi:FAD/FMN-containing dehydrogenase